MWHQNTRFENDFEIRTNYIIIIILRGQNDILDVDGTIYLRKINCI